MLSRLNPGHRPVHEVSGGAEALPRTVAECEIPLQLLQYFRMVPVHFVRTSRVYHIAFAGDIDYRVLLAIEQMLSCKTEVCLITSATLEAALLVMEQKGKCSDKSFDDRRGSEEIICITSSYALKLKAEDMRIVAFGEFMRIKLVGTGDTANLLFSRTSAGMEDSPVQSVLARVAG
jgi:hypothetical protein